MGSIPVGDPRANKKRIPLGGNVPDPSDPPAGCNLYPRCPYTEDKCRQIEPELVELEEMESHFVSCHYAQELELDGYDQLKVKDTG